MLANKVGRVYKDTLRDFVEECGVPLANERVRVGTGVDGKPVYADFAGLGAQGTCVFVRTQTGVGTAEDKIPFIALNIEHALSNRFAYIVLCGKGWSLCKKTYFTQRLAGEVNLKKVRVLSEADFRRGVVRNEICI